MQNNPIVSIITPAYNAEKYIAEAINSVLHQTYTNWKLLIIDDGSTDSTANIVKSFSDARILLIQQENGGVSSARNKGLTLAKGKYITFLDADDILPLNSLKARVQFLEENPNVEVVDGKIFVKDREMKKLIRVYEPYYNGLLLPRLVALDSRVFFNVCYMFKRDILGGDVQFKTNMTHAEDLLFYMELSNNHCVQYGFVQEEVYTYRSGHTSAMTNLNGLEDGYLQLMQEARKLKNVSQTDFFMFKAKIAKIMCLSWLSQKNLVNALKSIFYVFQLISKETR